MNYVNVNFFSGDMQNSKDYCYFTDLKLKKGDWCVVEVKELFKVVVVSKVKGISKSDRDRAHKWIVCKIDIEAYEQLKAKGETIMEIKRKLRERKEEAEEFMIYQQLANADPEIATLLGQLRDIDPNLVPAIEHKKK